MFDDNQVFDRTEKGDEQLDVRSSQLHSSSRRILRLIDGQRSLSDLLALARPGDLERIINELQTNGLIRLVGIAKAPNEDEQRRHEREQREELTKLQALLAGRFEQVLGVDGMVLEARLQDCVSLDVLRRVLREAIDTLARRSSTQVALELLEEVRPHYEKSALTLAARRRHRITRL